MNRLNIERIDKEDRKDIEELIEAVEDLGWELTELNVWNSYSNEVTLELIK